MANQRKGRNAKVPAQAPRKGYALVHNRKGNLRYWQVSRIARTTFENGERVMTLVTAAGKRFQLPVSLGHNLYPVKGAAELVLPQRDLQLPADSLVATPGPGAEHPGYISVEEYVGYKLPIVKNLR